MWKKIIIGAVVLFLAATFVFYKNNEAMTAPNGEVEAMQTRLQEGISKHKNVGMDKSIKAYAEMRTEWFRNQQAQFDASRSQLEEEDANVKEKTKEIEQAYTTTEEELKSIQEQLARFKSEVQEAAHLEEELTDMGEVVAKMTQLKQKNDAIELQVSQEESAIEALGIQNDTLSAKLDAAKKLYQDRQARISPPELQCSVLSADPQWDFVVLDAGVNKGIVIGSRLAAMRGDEKIAELNVTFVEANRASCDVVYSTLKTGERVQPGDRIISVRNK